jgi:hypothetical protein
MLPPSETAATAMTGYEWPVLQDPADFICITGVVGARQRLSMPPQPRKCGPRHASQPGECMHQGAGIVAVTAAFQSMKQYHQRAAWLAIDKIQRNAAAIRGWPLLTPIAGVACVSSGRARWFGCVLPAARVVRCSASGGLRLLGRFGPECLDDLWTVSMYGPPIRSMQ